MVLLSAGSGLFRNFAFPKTALGLDEDAGLRIMLLLGTWVFAIAAVVLLVAYWLMPRIFDRIKAAQARKMVCGTMGENFKAPPPAGAWITRFYTVLGMALLVAGLAVGYGMLKSGNLNVFELLEAGSLPELQARLQTDLSLLDNKNKAGETLLMVAVKRGDQNLVQMLLSTGAAVDARDHANRTPSFYTLDNPSLLRFLLQHGASVNATDGSGRTLLHAAIDQRNRIAIELLLNTGARINTVDYNGDTPLVKAVKNRLDVVDMLLVRGADPDKADKVGERPLHHAARIGNVDAAKRLVAAGAQTRLTSLQGWTSLHIAAINGEIGVAKILIESGMDVDIPCARKNRTALFVAVVDNELAMVEFLLEQGADLECADKDGTFPLNLAITGHHFELAAMLINAGVDVDRSDGSGLTARKLLAMHDQLSLLER